MAKCAVAEKIQVVTDPHFLNQGGVDHSKFRKPVTCDLCGAVVSGAFQGRLCEIEVKGKCQFPATDGKLIQIREKPATPTGPVSRRRSHF